MGNSAEHLRGLIRSTGVDPRLADAGGHGEHLISPSTRPPLALGSCGRPASTLRWTTSAWATQPQLPVQPAGGHHQDRPLLTRQILTDRKQNALLHSIVEMATINELLVVAEGVETGGAAGHRPIRRPLHPGVYYARPMPGEALSLFLNCQ